MIIDNLFSTENNVQGTFIVKGSKESFSFTIKGELRDCERYDESSGRNQTSMKLKVKISFFREVDGHDSALECRL